LGIKLERVKSILDVVGKKRKGGQKEKKPHFELNFQETDFSLVRGCLLIVDMCHAFVVGERSWMVCLTQ
jgi:hypothetical protein